MDFLKDRKDRMSMACGLEVMVQFYDHRSVEYVGNIPWDMKNCQGMSKGFMCRALIGQLPDEVIFRPNSPYSQTHHPQYKELIRNELQRYIRHFNSPLLELINKPGLEQILGSGQVFLNKTWLGQLMGDENAKTAR